MWGLHTVFDPPYIQCVYSLRACASVSPVLQVLLGNDSDVLEQEPDVSELEVKLG